MSSHPQNMTAARIRQMVETHRVTYVSTQGDALAHHITRLAGDDVQFDGVENMLLALQRAGHLSRVEAVRLQASYLREAKP